MTGSRSGKPIPKLSSRKLILFESHIEKTEFCWNWTGYLQPGGYGLFRIAQDYIGMALVHRIAYSEYIGPLVETMTIDHLCRNRRCVRPDHLEQVEQRENIQRGESLAADYMKREICLECKHELSLDLNGKRHCAECRRNKGRIRMREWRALNAQMKEWKAKNRDAE